MATVVGAGPGYRVSLQSKSRICEVTYRGRNPPRLWPSDRAEVAGPSPVSRRPDLYGPWLEIEAIHGGGVRIQPDVVSNLIRADRQLQELRNSRACVWRVEIVC